VLFTALVLALSLAWAVALGRQALPRVLRTPVWRATTRELGRDAARGARELSRLHRDRWPQRSWAQTKPSRARGSTSSRSS